MLSGVKPGLLCRVLCNAGRTYQPLWSANLACGDHATRNKRFASYRCVVLGGGTGGCAMASKMARLLGKGSVVVIEPCEVHYYQPMFTLVGSGLKEFSQTQKPMGDSLPNGIKWIKESVSSILPQQNTVTTTSGLQVEYDMLIVAVGLTLDYQRIKGAVDALENDPMVCSNYSPKYVNKTFKAFNSFKKGETAIFTMPPLPIKCAGAPQKIMYLFDDYLRKSGKRDGSQILYNTNLNVIFGVKKYADALLEVIKERDLTVNLQHNLIAVDHTKREAIFAKVGTNPMEEVSVKYDLLHISPPMVTPECLRKSGDLVNEAGFVDVNKDTLQHNKYKNVFAIGDCSSLPTSKTAAAVAGETGVLAGTIKSYLKGKLPTGPAYDGYTSCPLITKSGATILAEFDYDGKPLETFPFNQAKERWTMWVLKKDIMPFMYWHMLIKGWWHGPKMLRKLFSFGQSR